MPVLARCGRRSAGGRAAAPTSAHAPQLMLAPAARARAVVRQRVEEGVGRRVVALARRARAATPPTRTARRSRAARAAVSACRFHAPATFGASTRSKRGQRLLQQHAVVEHARRVDDAAQRRHARRSDLRSTLDVRPRSRIVSRRPRRDRHPGAARASRCLRGACSGTAHGGRPARGAARRASTSQLEPPPGRAPRSPPVMRYAARRRGRAAVAGRAGASGAATTLPMCRACAMQRNASTRSAAGNVVRGSEREPPGARRRRSASRSRRRDDPPDRARSLDSEVDRVICRRQAWTSATRSGVPDVRLADLDEAAARRQHRQAARR